MQYLYQCSEIGYPAGHNELDSLPQEFLRRIDGDLTVERAQDVIVRVYQRHAHLVL